MKNIKVLVPILLLCALMISLTSISAVNLNNSDNPDLTDISTPVNDKNIKMETNTPKTITLTNQNFNQYVTNGEFNDEVSDGDTIDVDGMFDSDKFSLNVNKSLNFISSKNNSYINVYTRSTGDFGEATGGQITFGHGASGSNITNLYFYNTRISFNNVSNVNINNISVIDYEAVIGSGTGHFIIGGQSDNVTIANSYFYTKDNGAHSTAVFSGCSNIIFENNTIIGVGGLGNLVYLNTFNVEEGASHSNFIIRNNVIDASQAGSQITCFAICLTGSNILIDNNTIDYKGYNICPIYGGQGVLENITIQNNNLKTVLLGNAGLIEVKYINNTKIINNTISALVVSKSEESTHKAEIYNNTIGGLILEADDCIIEDNTLKTINNTGNNNIINNNTISSDGNYTITTTGENTIITNNKLASKNYYGDESINGTARILENNTATTRMITINDDNLEEYLTYNSNQDKYQFNSNLNNTIISMNSSIIRQLSMPESFNATVTIVNAPNLYYLQSSSRKSNVSILNSFLPQTSINPGLLTNLSIENSTFMFMYPSPAPKMNYTENNLLLLNNTENTYILENDISSNDKKVTNIKNYTGYFDSQTNKLLSSNPDNMNLIIRKLNTTYTTPMIIDKPINITSYDSTIWNADITFASGSEGSTISGLIINTTLKIETNNIHVFNNTINKLIVNNSMGNNIHDNIINSTENAVELIGAVNSNVTNNIITTTDDYAISIDSDSFGNIIDNNTITAKNDNNIKAIAGNIQENTITNNNPKIDTTITIDTVDSTLINTEIPINVTVYSNYGMVENGYVVILVNGVEQRNQTLADGKLETTITPTQKGNNTIKVWYFPTDIYNINTQTKALQVNSIKTIIKINDITTVKVGENVTITTTIKDSSGNNVDEGYVIYAIKDDTYESNVTNGVSTVTFTTIETYRNQELTVTYTGAQTLDDSTNKTTLALNPGDVILTITQQDNDDTVTLTITVTDINQNKVKSGYIRFTGDVTDLVELQDGMLVYDINKSTSDMTINVTFRLNPAFETKTEEIIIKAPITTITELNDTIGLISTPTTITATVKDTNGTDINTGTVTFTDQEDNLIAEVNVIDGIAATTITSSEEFNTTITATYSPATNEYLPSTATASLSIQKPITNIALDEITPTAGETVTLTARVTDQLSNNITGGKIVFKINGKTLKDANGKVIYAKVIDGIAQANYTIPESYADKNITIQATYSGCTKYDKQTAEITTFVTKPEATLTIDQLPDSMQANTNITVKAKVQTGTTPITTGKVIFKINGKTLKDANGKVIYANVDANGEAILSNYNLGNLKVGAYTLKAVFTASGYDRLEATDTISIIA